MTVVQSPGQWRWAWDSQQPNEGQPLELSVEDTAQAEGHLQRMPRTKAPRAQESPSRALAQLCPQQENTALPAALRACVTERAAALTPAETPRGSDLAHWPEALTLSCLAREGTLARSSASSDNETP